MKILSTLFGHCPNSDCTWGQFWTLVMFYLIGMLLYCCKAVCYICSSHYRARLLLMLDCSINPVFASTAWHFNYCQFPKRVKTNFRSNILNYISSRVHTNFKKLLDLCSRWIFLVALLALYLGILNLKWQWGTYPWSSSSALSDSLPL